jgi:biopolymer transport protein ExbD
MEDAQMKYGGRAEKDSTIPTSSMADIAFLLIIFFMVTAVFSATKGLDLTVPEEDSDPVPPETEEAVFIHVRAEETLVDCRPMQPDQILSYLEPRLTRNPNKPIILYTDPDAEYRRMVEVYDTLSAGRTPADERSFTVKDIMVPTQAEIRGYIDVFGENPLETRCRE